MHPRIRIHAVTSLDEHHDRAVSTIRAAASKQDIGIHHEVPLDDAVGVLDYPPCTLFHMNPPVALLLHSRGKLQAILAAGEEIAARRSDVKVGSAVSG